MEHGRKKRTREDASAEARAKEAERITEYNAATAELVQRKAQRDYTQAALDLTTRVLELNPEFTTGWNYRRRILCDGLLAGLAGQEAQAILANDLHLTSLSLRKNPKNYSVWEHRKWLLRTMPDPDWGFELKMVEKQLDLDVRNFHAWNYRRHIVASCRAADPPPSWSIVKRPRFTVHGELAYTHAKISSNFSNFSAWHYRSKLFGKLSAGEQTSKQEEELELVRHALWTDPNDQSGWLYHAWLIGEGRDADVLRREIASIEELAEMEPDSKFCLEALLRYKQLLLQKHALAAQLDHRALREACQSACQRLAGLDPPRLQRYRWLESQIPDV